MKRRSAIFLAALGVMLVFGVLGSQKAKPTLLVLEWAMKAADETPPVALLIEMGIKDDKVTNWSGHATLTGAKVVHREGYRFRTGDKLIEPNRWEASSHRPFRAPQGQPAVVRQEGFATVGVVLHLADVKDDAALNIECGDQKATIAVKDPLAGKPQPFGDGHAVVRRISTATPVVTDKTEDDFPAAAYGPDGTLWVAYISYTVRDDARRTEQKPLQKQPENFKAFYTPEFGDQLFVKYYRNGKWSEPIAVTGPKEDLVRCAIAVNKLNDVTVFYSAYRKKGHVFCSREIRRVKLGNEPLRFQAEVINDRIEEIGEGYINPICCLIGDGMNTLFVPQIVLSPNWQCAAAIGPDGQCALVRDKFDDGDYDIELEDFGKIAGSSRFEARPTCAYDQAGRLWIAYEEGPEQWGKDYGALVPDKGNPLYSRRTVRVVCLQDGKLYKPAAELPISDVKPPHGVQEGPAWPSYERAVRYAYPKIGIDGKGRIWVTYRQKFGSRYTSTPGSYWLTFARRLDGDHWSEPIEIHHSDGLLDSRPVLLPHKSGGLIVIHNTDGRYTTPEVIDNQIYMSVVDLPGKPAEPKLVPHEPGKKDEKVVQRAKDEQAAVKRIRDYRIDAGGKKLRLLRGEFHRHTEISWDGGPDGSLEDMFRYAIDAAQMDWIGNGDHDSGAGREYSWWLIQKFTDAYHIKGQFTPMFTYERSVAYPHGHRNCVFAQRGVRTLPRLAEPDQAKRVGAVHADDTKMLYRYLHEFNGICASHTSATSMGTDWRDHDPKVEPFVEIYQGDRMSYEHEGAPRAGYDPKSGMAPPNIAGWFPKGFVNLALEKGHRLGFESSSDHWSTHISYCVVLADKNDRESILAAMKERHVYGATDDIIVEFRSGEHLMGDEFKTMLAPELQMHVVGTRPLAQIDIMKDGKLVDAIKPGKQEYQGKWTDPNPSPGTHYYYIRVQQTDGELAWASPLWIEMTK